MPLTATATAIPGKEATDVAPAILAHFYTFGVPQILLTDGGREFRNSLQKQIWEAWGIRHDVTTPYHPPVSYNHPPLPTK